jgi:hypothetical protein
MEGIMQDWVLIYTTISSLIILFLNIKAGLEVKANRKAIITIMIMLNLIMFFPLWGRALNIW